MNKKNNNNSINKKQKLIYIMNRNNSYDEKGNVKKEGNIIPFNNQKGLIKTTYREKNNNIQEKLLSKKEKENSEENNYNISSIIQKEQNKKNNIDTNEKKVKLNLFKNNINKNKVHNFLFRRKTGELKTEIIYNNNKEKKENKNEEKIIESKELKSSIMTDNNSNLYNNQGYIQDNYSSTSYQTLQKLLNKIEPRPLNTKNNISHLNKFQNALYKTSNNFKSKIFNNNGSIYTLNNINKKNVLKNNLNGQFSPIYTKYNKNISNYSTKTDFYFTKNKLNNNSENQKFLNIETEAINSNKILNHLSSKKFQNKNNKNFFSEGNSHYKNINK